MKKFISEVVRETWPRVKSISVKGEKYWQADARRKGTSLKREAFKVQAEALKFAAQVAKEYGESGREGATIGTELRAWAMQGQRILTPYGKTVLQACEFFRDHLETEDKRKGSHTIESLADKWHDECAACNDIDRADETLRGIRYGRNSLKAVFAGKRILEITTEDIRNHLDGLKVSKRRKKNILTRWSQFFNWSVKNRYASENPCAAITIKPDTKRVVVFKPEEAQTLMELCETKFPKMTLFFALALFAGLRPDDDSEAQSLVWEDIDLETRTIFIHAAKTKVNEDRSVPIEDSLYHWLTIHRPAKAKGLVTESTNFKKRRQAVHIAMGYRAQGENEEAGAWPQDITRHSYCSYSLAMGLTKGVVAERSGNSPKIIKKHYKQVVPKSKGLAYWSILPKGVADKSNALDDALNRELAA
jgi:integrase